MAVEAKNLRSTLWYDPIMERFLVKPAYFRHPETGRLCKLYLIYDMDRPKFDSNQNLMPFAIIRPTPGQTIALWMEELGWGNQSWRLAPSRLLTWKQVNEIGAHIAGSSCR